MSEQEHLPGKTRTGCFRWSSCFMLLLTTSTFLVWYFNLARKKAKTSSCQCDIRSVGFALLMYAADNGDHFPVLSPNASWTSAVYPYCKNQNLFLCPTGGLDVPENLMGKVTDYAMNAYLSGAMNKSIPDRKYTVLLCDYERAFNPWITDLPVKSSMAVKHLGGANYQFVDGHCMWLDPSHWDSIRENRYLVHFVP